MNKLFNKINFTKKNLTILLSIFAYVFAIFPLSYGMIDIKIPFLLSPLLLAFILISKRIKIKDKYYIPIILLLAFITRIGIVLFLYSKCLQVSDFGAAFQNAEYLNFNGAYYRVFTHWILYPTIIHLIYKIFGTGQVIALISNAIILILNSILIYKLGSKLFKNKKYGFISSLIYIFWPANILYTLVFTQEHLCVLLLLSSIYLFFNNKDNNKINKKDVFNHILIGIFLGISVFLKNFAPVFIVAFSVFYLLEILYKKRYYLNRFLLILILFFSFSLTKNSIFSLMDSLVGEKVARNIIPCYLNVGLRGNGTYSVENYSTYFTTLEKNKYNFSKTNKIIMKNLFSDLKSNISMSFFSDKAEIIIGGDSARLQWANITIGFDNDNIIAQKIYKINQCYYTMLIFLMALGSIKMVKSNNLHIFLLYLIFFGSNLMLLLVEAQNRYMYSIQFIMCLLSVLGISYLNEKLLKKKVHV